MLVVIAREGKEGEAEVDGNAAGLFLGEAVGIGAGERGDQRALAVIDVTGGGEDVAGVGQCKCLGQCTPDGVDHEGVLFGGDGTKVQAKAIVEDITDDGGLLQTQTLRQLVGR